MIDKYKWRKRINYWLHLWFESFALLFIWGLILLTLSWSADQVGITGDNPVISFGDILQWLWDTYFGLSLMAIGLTGFSLPFLIYGIYLSMIITWSKTGWLADKLVKIDNVIEFNNGSMVIVKDNNSGKIKSSDEIREEMMKGIEKMGVEIGASGKFEEMPDGTKVVTELELHEMSVVPKDEMDTEKKKEEEDKICGHAMIIEPYDTKPNPTLISKLHLENSQLFKDSRKSKTFEDYEAKFIEDGELDEEEQAERSEQLHQALIPHHEEEE